MHIDQAAVSNVVSIIASVTDMVVKCCRSGSVTYLKQWELSNQDTQAFPSEQTW